MAGNGLLDRLVFRSESDSYSDSDSELNPESDSFPQSESEPELEPDPKPKRSRKSPTPQPVVRVTAAVKKEARETLEVLADLPIMLWSRRDPLCAGEAEKHMEEILDATMAILVKKPAWMSALADMGTSGDVIRLGKALYPVVVMLIAHHVTKTAQAEGEGEEDDLSGFAAPRLAG